MLGSWFTGYRRVSFMALTLEQFGIDRLNSEQRFELIGLIWDSLPDDAPFTPPGWHLRELERRIAADADPGAAEPWEAVRARLSRKP
jgi:putative addiction module component (TIGR02574 family)